jgi:hypothetical protein
MENLDFLCITDTNREWYEEYGKWHDDSLRKTWTELILDPAIPPVDIYY